jgi:cell division protein FtsL
MDSNNLLGLYFAKDTATVVRLASKGKDFEVTDSFTVTANNPEQPKIQALASLIAQTCEEKKLSFSETAVAIDCSLFMQHNVHSEFADRKQINSTIRFDTEESLAADISETALVFGINSTSKEGSNLTVFTAQKKILSEILLSLQQYNFDPITITPDVICLSKLIFNKFPKDETIDGTMFGMLSGRSGYLIAPRNKDGAGLYESSVVRTFLVGPRQNRTELLAREIMITTALFRKDEKINALRIFDSAGTIDYPSITDRTAIFARGIDFFGKPDSVNEENENRVNRIDFAIAYGAALSLHEKEQTINFRDDFSPYQGKKIKTQKALKFAMFSVTILLIAVGLYFQMNLFSINRDIKKSRAKFDRDYEIVMGKQLSKNASTITATKNLNNELNAIKKGFEGIITTGTSVSSKLTLVLKAFNKCAKQTDLKVKVINITEKNISITGDTMNRANTTTFFNVLKETGLDIKSTTYDTTAKTKRDSFSVTLEPTS